MALQAQEWTISGLSVELKKDRRILARIIDDANLDPVRVEGRSRYYRMADVVQAMIGGEALDLETERALLAQEQTRRLKRENDEAEGELLRRELFVELLQDASRQAVSLLETIPLDLKRRFPETKTREIEFVKLTIAKVRNAVAAIEVKN